MVAQQLNFLSKTYMKAKQIVAGLVALAAALSTYYIIKRRNRNTVDPVSRTHHLTDVFSKAKARTLAK
jgi:hypothetical protein